MDLARGLTELVSDAPEIAPPDATQSSAAQERLERLRRRFLYCWSHPFWQKWRREATEDYQFLAGNQWDPEILERLKAKKRAVLTINEIRPVVLVLTGYESSARLEARLMPEGPEDLQSVTILGRLYKRSIENEDGDFTRSEGFKDGVATGIGAYYVGVDYDDDPIHGRPRLRRIPFGEVLWDPDWQEYDLSDCRDIFWHRMVPVADLEAIYPDRKEEIARALEAQQRELEPSGLVERLDPQDAYKPNALEDVGGLALYDEARGEVRVIEAWYRGWETVYLQVDHRTVSVEEIPEDALPAARALAAVDPSIEIIERRRRRWDMSLFLPAVGIELDYSEGERHPFPNDTASQPIVPFLAYRELDEVLGVIRNLKDPQREVNKRRSALADNVSRHGHIKWFAWRNTLENPEELESAEPTVHWLRSGTPHSVPPPQAITPPQMPQWIWQMQAISKLEIREISGINADLLGYTGDDASGIAIARRQQQGQVIATSLFDNYRRTGRLIGRRYVRRIQQVYTTEMTVRLLPESGNAPEFVTINARRIDELGRMRVLNDIPSLQYDVVMADAPSSPSARAQALAALLEVLQRIPALAVPLAPEIIALTDLPNRDEIKARVEQVLQLSQAQAAAQGQMGGPPGMASQPGPMRPRPVPSGQPAPRPPADLAAARAARGL